MRPPAEINRHRRQRLVHGHQEISRAQDAALGTERASAPLRPARCPGPPRCGADPHPDRPWPRSPDPSRRAAPPGPACDRESGCPWTLSRLPRPSRFTRRRMSVSVVVRRNVGAFSFPIFLQILGVCRIARAPWLAQLLGAHAMRLAAVRQHAQKRHACALRDASASSTCRPDKAPCCGSALPSKKCKPSGSGFSRSTSSMATTRRNRSRHAEMIERVVQLPARAPGEKRQFRARGPALQPARRHQPRSRHTFPRSSVHAPVNFMNCRFTLSYGTLPERRYPIGAQPPVVVVAGLALPLLNIGVASRACP